MIKTEVMVIGAGPGGYVAAIKLAKLGKKVLVVEKDRLGGVCLNCGCIPSKALVAAAGLIHKLKKASEIGIRAQSLTVDWAKIQQWKSGMVGNLGKGIANLFKGNGIETLTGEARFLSRRSAQVRMQERTETVEFENALIVSGSRPIPLPGFAFDGRDILSSTEALDLQEIPRRLLVVGGGVVGLEIGTFYAKLGSRVAVVELTGQLLPGMDPDLVAPVSRNLAKMGVEIFLSSRVKGFLRKEGALETSLETPEGSKTVLVDKILLSVGRAPNTGELGLEAAGVEKDPKGFIRVDGLFETTADGLYAAGDVIGPPFLAHKASREGISAALCIAGQKPEPVGPLPWTVFTDPEIASVGLTEIESRTKSQELAVGRFPFSALGRAQASRDTEGFVKVIADKATGKLLGAAIAGPQASDLISEAALAIRLGASVHDIASTVHPHPTFPEAFQEAAEAAFGQAIHILAKRI